MFVAAKDQARRPALPYPLQDHLPAEPSAAHHLASCDFLWLTLPSSFPAQPSIPHCDDPSLTIDPSSPIGHFFDDRFAQTATRQTSTLHLLLARHVVLSRTTVSRRRRWWLRRTTASRWLWRTSPARISTATAELRRPSVSGHQLAALRQLADVFQASTAVRRVQQLRTAYSSAAAIRIQPGTYSTWSRKHQESQWFFDF